MFKDGRVIVCIVAWIATAIAVSVIVYVTKQINYLVFLAPTAATVAILGDFNSNSTKGGDENE